MAGRRSALVTALIVGLTAGVGYALVEIWIDCRRPSSEECFWAREYFLPTLGLSLAIVGGVAAGLVYAALIWRRRRGSGNDAA